MSPFKEISPVKDTALFIKILLISDKIAVVIATPQEGPSFLVEASKK